MKSKGRKREQPEERRPDGEKNTKEIFLPKCPRERECCVSCQAYREGKCAALADVTFRNNLCPFYKEREAARAERIAAMEKLEDTGREDLILKYYLRMSRFERILGNEMVGISYNFDDEGFVYAEEGPDAGMGTDCGQENCSQDGTLEDDGPKNGIWQKEDQYEVHGW